MLRKNLTWALALSSLLFFSAPVANGVWNGSDAPVGNRAVAIYNGPVTEKDQTGLSGFLYSPYLVFTVAHGFYGDDRISEPQYRNIPYSVGLPGEKSGSNAQRIAVDKVFISKNFVNRNMFQEGGTRITRQNDFAVLVLREKMPIDNKKVNLLTPELHEKLIAEKATAFLTGYGHQTGDSETNPQSPDEKLDRTPKTISIEMYGKKVPIQTMSGVFPFNRFPGRNFTYDQTLNFYFPYGSETSICSGDSGSPYYIDNGSEITYLGANSSAIGISNCGTLQMSSVGGFISGDPVYLFSTVIAEAEAYVAKLHGSQAKSIQCIKGKTVKTLKSASAKCPAGYKLKK